MLCFRSVVFACLVAADLFVACWGVPLEDPPSPETPCYDSNGSARACFPPAVNATQNATANATNTCGVPAPEDFCRLTILQIGDEKKETITCASREYVLEKVTTNEQQLAGYRQFFHSAQDALDQELGKVTWWQSQSMAVLGNQYHDINLTISLGKAFELKDIDVRFKSLRPESWALYKSSDYGATWTPYEYFSRSCTETYGVPDSLPLIRNGSFMASGTSPLCSSRYSTRLPGDLARAEFQPLQYRTQHRSEYRDSAALREFVTATDLRLRFNRMGTFSDEIENRVETDQCYYYTLEDIRVIGRCQCHGHSAECRGDAAGSLECVCGHNTMGRDCQQCQAFFVDRPWTAATGTEAGACKECQCYGHAVQCDFSMEEYERSGNTSGGVCQDCADDTRGTHCELCGMGFFRSLDQPPTLPDNPCQECHCVVNGTVPDGCAELGGDCTCKNYTHGDKCQLCEDFAFGFGSNPDTGCTDCECVSAGTRVGSLSCDNVTGQCGCKVNVQGRSCDVCQDTFWKLSEDNAAGCQPCACSQLGSLSPLCDKETGQCRCKQRVTGRQCDEVVPAAFIPNLDHNTIEGESGTDLGTNNTKVVPTYDGVNVTGTGTLEIAGPGAISWSPVVVPVSGPYIVVVRYSLDGEVFWSQASLVFERSSGQGPPPDPRQCIESGSSVTLNFDSPPQGDPQAHQFDEEACLRSGVTYRLSLNAIGDGSERNGSSIKIDSILLIPSWKFIAQTPLGGDGSNGTSLTNTSFADCVTARAMAQHSGEDLDECRDVENAVALQLNTLSDCDCDAVGSIGNASASEPIECEVRGGQCPCKDGVGGRQCDMCKPGYYGFGMAGCTECDCDPLLTVHPNGCDTRTGVCVCLDGVDTSGDAGCAHCIDGYKRDNDNGGCVRCGCDLEGTESNTTCNETTGQCSCIAGVVALDCSECAYSNQFLSSDGCKQCYCDEAGSIDERCNRSGVCQCRDNAVGLKCDACAEGTFGRHADLLQGCKPCYCHGHSQQCHSTNQTYVKKRQQIFLYKPRGALSLGSGSGSGAGSGNGAGAGDVASNTFYDPGDSPIELVDADGAPDLNSDVYVNPESSFIEVVQSDPSAAVFIKVPPSLLSGNLQAMYGMALRFALATERSDVPLAMPAAGGDVILRTNDNETVSFILTPPPHVELQSYVVHFVAKYWSPEVSPLQFQHMLGNVNSIAIRMAHTHFGNQRTTSRLMNVLATFPVLDANAAEHLPYIEQCTCPTEYTGGQCEFCAEGFRRELAGGTAQVRCVNCSCNGHGSTCRPSSGECYDCGHNTTGYSCEECRPGFYGDATRSLGDAACQLCSCGVAGTMTNASDGDAQLPCNTSSGQCVCKPGVTGRACDICDDGFYNLTAVGCTPCACSTTGSTGSVCNPTTGQCDCIGNVQGLPCDRCPENFHNLSAGCLECPSCYGLVLDYMVVTRRDLTQLESSLVELSDPSHPVFSDSALNESINDLLQRVELTSAAMSRLAGLSLSLQVHLRPFLASLDGLRRNVDGLRSGNLTQLRNEIMAAAAGIGELEAALEESTGVASASLDVLTGHAANVMDTLRARHANQSLQVSITRQLLNESILTASQQAAPANASDASGKQLQEDAVDLLRSSQAINATLHGNAESIRQLRNVTESVEERLSAAASSANDAATEANRVLTEAQELYSAASTDDLEQSLTTGQASSAQVQRHIDAITSDVAGLEQRMSDQAATLATVGPAADRAVANYSVAIGVLAQLSADIKTAQGSVNMSMSRHRVLFTEARDMKEVLTDFHATVTHDRTSAEEAEASVGTAADLVRQARGLMNSVHREMDDTQAAVATALTTANSTLLRLTALSELSLEEDSENTLQAIAALESSAMSLRSRASQLLNRTQLSLQMAGRNRQVVDGIARLVSLLAIRVASQRQRIAAGNQELDTLETAAKLYPAELARLDRERISSQARLDRFEQLKTSIGFPALLANLEQNGKELDDEVEQAEERLQQARLAVNHLQAKDSDLPTTCIRRETPP